MCRLAGLALPLVLASLVACSDGSTAPVAPPRIAAIELDPSEIVLRVGETAQIEAIARDSIGRVIADPTLVWLVSDTAVAGIADGTIIGKRAGRTHLVVSGDSASVEAPVRVYIVGWIELVPSTVAIRLGAATELTALVRDQSGMLVANATVTWSVADSSIAGVSAAGVLTGRRFGRTTVTATADAVEVDAAVLVYVGGDDDFTTNTIADYTIYVDPSVSNAFEWFVADGMMHARGVAEQSVAISGPSFANGAVEADSNYGDDGGIVMRFVDNHNYFMLAMRDDSTATGLTFRNIEIYQRQFGTFYSIATYGGKNIVWPRGTTRRVQLEMQGGKVRALVDGVPVDSATGITATGAGRIGLRHYASGNNWAVRYDRLGWRIYPE